MLIEVVSLSFAFVFGLLVRQVGLPPLVGFLAAGFALNAYGPAVGLPQGRVRFLTTLPTWAYCCFFSASGSSSS